MTTDRSGGVDRAGTALVTAGMFAAPMGGVRAIPPPPTINVSDALLLVGFAVLLPRLLKNRISLPLPYIVGVLVVLVATLTNTLYLSDPVSSLSAFRLVYAAVLLPLLFTQWAPPWKTVTVLAWAYIAGTFTSLLWGLVQGPLANGRYIGLSTHPNGLGHTLALSTSLLPFLAYRATSRRKFVLVFLGVGCLIGGSLTGSRATVVALALLGIAYLVVERKLVGGLVAAFFGCLAVLLSGQLSSWLLGHDELARLLGQGDAQQSDQARIDFAHQALTRFYDHPLVGSGFIDMRTAHDTYLEMLAAVGIVGLAGFLLMVLTMLTPLLRAQDPRRLIAYPAVFLAGIGAVEVLFETTHWAVLSLALLAWQRQFAPPPAPETGEAEPSQIVSGSAASGPGSDG